MDGVRVLITETTVQVTSPTCTIAFERYNKSEIAELAGADLTRMFTAINALRDLNIPMAELEPNGAEESSKSRARSR